MESMPRLKQDPKREEGIGACVGEVREAVSSVQDQALRTLILQKLENLEEAIFDKDDWIRVRKETMVLKIAILGASLSGQVELLSSFLHGTAGELGENHRSPMELLTGVKSPKVSPTTRTYRTIVPWHGEDRQLIVRVSTGDPSPQVLAWADAFLLVCDISSRPSFQALNAIQAKMNTFKRIGDLPVAIVGVHGLSASEEGGVPDADIKAHALANSYSYYSVNPFSGENVEKMFNDVVHATVDMVVLQLDKARIGKMTHRKPTASLRTRQNSSEEVGPGRSIPIKQGILKKVTKRKNGGESTKRWVTLTTGMLTYYNNLQDYMANAAGKSINLAQASLKRPMQLKNGPARERSRHVITLVNFTNRQWEFEALSVEEMNSWLAAIEKEIFECVNRNISAGVKNESLVQQGSKRFRVLSAHDRQQLAAVPGNDKCAECDAPSPTWACLNLGILVCIQCSGIHRNLGVHISRVRSIELDDWSELQLSIMEELGNARACSTWEGLADRFTKPTAHSSTDDKIAWINAKYSEKKFLTPLDVPPGQALYAALVIDADADAALALAHCTPGDLVYQEPDSGQTCLHVCVSRRMLTWAQRILWINPQTSVKNARGETAVQLARSMQLEEMVELLLGQEPSGSSVRRQTHVAADEPLAAQGDGARLVAPHHGSDEEDEDEDDEDDNEQWIGAQASTQAEAASRTDEYIITDGMDDLGDDDDGDDFLV